MGCVPVRRPYALTYAAYRACITLVRFALLYAVGAVYAARPYGQEWRPGVGFETCRGHRVLEVVCCVCLSLATSQLRQLYFGYWQGGSHAGLWLCGKTLPSFSCGDLLSWV